jgi:CBS domain-containing protein
MITIQQTDVTGNEIRSRKLTHVDREASVLATSMLMRKSGASELLVTGKTDGKLYPLGIVTANDIVTRVVAAGLDPAVLTAGDIACSGLPATGAAHRDAVRRRRGQKHAGEALAVMDGDCHLVATIRLDELLETH